MLIFLLYIQIYKKNKPNIYIYIYSRQFMLNKIVGYILPIFKTEKKHEHRIISFN